MTRRGAFSTLTFFPLLPFLGFLSASADVDADEIFLRGGGHVTGRIVEQNTRTVTIEAAPGLVTLPMSRVEKIVESRSPLEAWRERADSLAASDVAGWAALARWAQQNQLLTQAREAWQRVLAVSPHDADANLALSRVSVEGRWMSEQEAYRAQGYVQFEGEWISPAEHERRLRERASDEASAQEQREAEVRVREAEARAREAEARAREAEARAREAEIPAEAGIPIWPVNGAFGPRLHPGCCEPRPGPHPRPHPQQTSPLPPPPSVPESSIGEPRSESREPESSRTPSLGVTPR